jgi:excisionase family DNA binding protein
MAGRKITVAEVVREYRLGERTVRRYIASGRLTAYRVGPRLIRLDADQVERELIGAKLGADVT